MIPYDDLVVALQTWRARQGLPVAQLTNIAPAGPASDSGSMRAVPPSAPPAKAAVPPPLAPADTHDDVDEAGLLVEEAHYENEGDDFAMAFGQPAEPDFESTSVGSPPPPLPGSQATGQRDSFGGSTEPEPPAGKHNRNDDW